MSDIKKRVLIIDDEPSMQVALRTSFEKHDYEVVTLGSKEEFEKMASKNNFDFDLALVDMILSDGDGIDLISSLKKLNPDIKINIFTGHGSIDCAVRAMKQGAFHFFTKPFTIDEVLNVCFKALKQSFLEKENKELRACIKKQYSFSHIIGQSDPVVHLLDLIKKVTRSDATTLIEGESGTGKELVAKAIHFNSSRSSKAFVPVHCGAIPPDLLESELFGHTKGSFTGAYRDHKGRFEMAQGGTIFLDEISTMPPALQVKLLRVLQERVIEPLGSTHGLACDVRVIAATNSKIEKDVMENRFREDLYYRLNVIPIQVPTLRQRADDIPLLVQFFIQQMNQKNRHKISGFSSEALECLMNYQWPGNIRELENLVERMSVFKIEGCVEVKDLPPKYRSPKVTSLLQSKEMKFHFPDKEVDFKETIDHIENTLILEALEKTKWNRNQASILLKMNRTTLLEKIKKRDLNRFKKPTKDDDLEI